MISYSKSHESEFHAVVLDLVKRIMVEAGANQAEVTVQPREESDGPGFSINVRPLNPSAVPITIHVEGKDRVDVFLGMGSRIELYPERRSTVLHSLEQYLRAAVKGDFEEVVVYGRDGQVVRARGRIVVDGSPRRLYYNWLLPLPRLPWFETKQVQKHYSSYATL